MDATSPRVLATARELFFFYSDQHAALYKHHYQILEFQPQIFFMHDFWPKFSPITDDLNLRTLRKKTIFKTGAGACRRGYANSNKKHRQLWLQNYRGR